MYHKFANCDAADSYSRRFVHGLNPSFLSKHGFANEAELIADFKDWLSWKDYRFLFSNNPTIERRALSLNVTDICLPIWLERVHCAYHLVARRFKELNIPILCISCYKDAHSLYEKPPYFKNETVKVKADHGHHCSLFDAYELYLFYILHVL